MVKQILLLGDLRLYQISSNIEKCEAGPMKKVVDDLHDTLIDFRKTHGSGRAIAAPQIGIFKRLIYMDIDKPMVFINPILNFCDDATMEILDDCMSFPDLLVNVRRYKKCTIHFKDLDWNDHQMNLEGDLSELLQHEYDHLDGILATMRAIDNQSFCLKSQKRLFQC